MLHDESLLEEIAKALPTDKFTNAIKDGLTDPSKPMNKEVRPWSLQIRGGTPLSRPSLICSGGSVSDSSSRKVSWWPIGWPFWRYEDPWINLARILVASTVEVRQGIHQGMWYLCSIQSHPPQAIRFASPTSHSQPAVRVYFHGFHY